MAGSSLSGYNGSETTLIAILNAQRAVDITSTAGVATNVTNIATVNTKLGTISASAMGTTAATVGPAILELHGELTTATANIAGVAAANVAVAGDTMTGTLITPSSGLSGSTAGLSAATLLTLGTGSGTAIKIDSNIAGVAAANVAVAGDTMTGLLTVREASGASPGIRAATALTLGAGSGTTMTMNSSQRLGIGTAPHASHKVDVNGNLNATNLSVGGTDVSTLFVEAGEAFQDAVGAMLGGTETGGITVTYDDTNNHIDFAIADDGHNHTTSQVDDLAEFVQDTVGGMFSGNSESGINVTYEDGDGTADFDVNDPTITLTGAVTGAATMTNLGSITIATSSGAANVITADIADDAVTGAKIADDTVAEANMADDAIGSAQMKSLSTLLIINSAGTTVKTLHGAGA